MIEYCTSTHANKYLEKLIGQPLQYGVKSPDTDLYDIGFGEYVQRVGLDGKIRNFPSYVIHVTCDFKIIWRSKKRTDYYHAETSADQFALQINKLIGHNVRRVALSDKNDLWLDFGDCWIVFIAFETGEESWRFFTSRKADPHLLASDSWLRLDF